MKELKDKKIQEMLEKGLLAPDAEMISEDKDFKTYQLLFDELKKEPATDLPYNFSAMLTAQIQAKKDTIINLQSFLLAALVAFAFIIVFYISLSIVNYNYASSLITILFKYKLIFVFVLISFLIIQYLDQKLVKPKL